LCCRLCNVASLMVEQHARKTPMPGSLKGRGQY
jgi:hypothetical protein